MTLGDHLSGYQITRLGKWFKVRLRSVAETSTYLKHRLRLTEDIIPGVLTELRQHKLLDDERFATARVQSRVRQGWGPHRIKIDLIKLGVSKEIIGKTLQSLEFSPSDLIALAQKRFKTLKNLPREVQFRRLAGYLLRKGHPSDSVFRTVKQILKKSD